MNLNEQCSFKHYERSLNNERKKIINNINPISLRNFYGNFSFFLAARAIQAIGAGGIMPIANSVIGNSFPEEKRGSALGLVGMIYGVGNILGPTLGSSIINLAGSNNWGWLFFINVPISLIILLLSVNLENSKASDKKPMDLLGAILLGGVIGSLMYALTNLDFFNFVDSVKTTAVYPYLIIFAVLTPLMIYIENKAKDPVLNIKYFKNKQMLFILIIAFVVDVGMMGMIFIPQLSENILKLKAENGGYLVTILAIFAGIAAPVSGTLIDKKSAKFVLILGFIFNIAGALSLAFLATKLLNFPSIILGLGLMGLGVGFTMEAPLNYLVLQTVAKEESASGLATMSLLRSIGLAISPGIMIGFVVNASKELQPKLMSIFQTGGAMQMKPSTGNMDAFKALQNADVTTIVPLLKKVLGGQLPPQIKQMVIKSIDASSTKIIDTFQSVINTGYAHMYTDAAIISFVGLLATLVLSKNKVKIN